MLIWPVDPPGGPAADTKSLKSSKRRPSTYLEVAWRPNDHVPPREPSGGRAYAEREQRGQQIPPAHICQAALSFRALLRQ
jgi:hypothetical protein